VRLEPGDHSGWHDLIIRIDKNRLEQFGGKRTWPTVDIFVDGVLRRRSYSAGRVAWVQGQIFLHDQPGTRIGAEPGGRAPFKGLIDHVALWNRALNNDEVASLSAGLVRADPIQVQQLLTPNFGGAMLPDDLPQEERCRILDREMPGALKQLLESQPLFPRFHLALPGVVMNTHALHHNGFHHNFPITETLGKGYPWIDNHYYRHLVSEDLVQWKLMPLPIRKQLFPNGTFVFREDRSVSIIAGPRLEMATSRDDNLATWYLEEENPRIVEDIPGGFRMRDNAIFKHKDRWYMAAQPRPGSKDHRLLLYRSPDLMNWTWAGVLLENFPGECAQVLPFEDKLIIFGADRGYVVGTFDMGAFQPLASGKVRHGSGRSLQYPAIDSSGKFRVLWDCFYGHMTSAAKEDTKRGFTSSYGLPLDFSLREDNTLAFQPIQAIQELRQRHARLPNTELADGEEQPIKGVFGGELEVIATFEGVSGKAGIYLQQGEHRAEIRYNSERHTAELDLNQMPFLPIYGRSRVWLRGSSDEPGDSDHNHMYRIDHDPSLVVSAPLPGKPGRPVTLRVFYDRSLVEVFAEGIRIMEWTFFEDPSSVAAGVVARGGPARLTQLDAWEMDTIWKAYVKR